MIWTGQLGPEEVISGHMSGKNIPGSQHSPRKGQEVGNSMNKMMAGTGSRLGG